MAFVELSQFIKGVVADDIRVQDKEGGVILAEDFLRKFEGTGGAKGFRFDGEFNLDVVFFFILIREEKQSASAGQGAEGF